jgi:organic hydroperoxide reductase OsmC/OhrA
MFSPQACYLCGNGVFHAQNTSDPIAVALEARGNAALGDMPAKRGDAALRRARALRTHMMQAFPHHYAAVAKAGAQGDVTLEGERLPPLTSAPPAEFGGPGDRWSPESLFVAAVADCFVLTFRGIAGVSRFPWMFLECSVTGTVDRLDRITQFTALEVRARLRVPIGAKEDQARRLLAKAEETCLVTNSLKVRPHLEAVVEFEEQ